MIIKLYEYYLHLTSKVNWCTNNNKILLIKGYENWRIIHTLSVLSNRTNWLIDNKKILTIGNDKKNVIKTLNQCHPHWEEI